MSKSKETAVPSSGQRLTLPCTVQRPVQPTSPATDVDGEIFVENSRVSGGGMTENACCCYQVLIELIFIPFGGLSPGCRYCRSCRGCRSTVGALSEHCRSTVGGHCRCCRGLSDSDYAWSLSCTVGAVGAVGLSACQTCRGCRELSELGL